MITKEIAVNRNSEKPSKLIISIVIVFLALLFFIQVINLYEKQGSFGVFKGAVISIIPACILLGLSQLIKAFRHSSARWKAFMWGLSLSVYSLGAPLLVTLGKGEKESDLEKFLQSYVVNNPKYKYPVRVNESTNLLRRELVRKRGGELFILELYQLGIQKSTLQKSTEEIKEIFQKELKVVYCSELEQKENLFRGYSKVGLIQRIIDVNNSTITEVVIEHSNC